MNTATIKSHWNVAKGKLKQKYGQLTDDDLRYEEGKEQELIGRLQKRTGKSREELQSFLRNECDCDFSAISNSSPSSSSSSSSPRPWETSPQPAGDRSTSQSQSTQPQQRTQKPPGGYSAPSSDENRR